MISARELNVNMKTKILVVLFSVLFLTSNSFAYVKITKNEVISGGKKRTYYLFIPKSLKKETPAPLLLLFHGSGRDGRILIEHWQRLAEQEGIILAGPNARDSAGWFIPEDGPQFIYDLVEKLKSEQPIDSRRVYLFGHSAGAGFGLFMSAMESNYFAATAVSAGAIRRDDYSMLDHAERKTPIALFIGTHDPLFSLTEVRATRDAFKDRGFTIELTEISFHDHNYYSKSTEINEKSWNFLKRHRLEDEQKYKQYQFKSN